MPSYFLNARYSNSRVCTSVTRPAQARFHCVSSIVQDLVLISEIFLHVCREHGVLMQFEGKCLSSNKKRQRESVDLYRGVKRFGLFAVCLDIICCIAERSSCNKAARYYRRRVALLIWHKRVSGIAISVFRRY